MGIYIKGMEMPTSCAECWLMDGEDSWCTACRGRHLYPEYRYGIKDRPDWCPLVPVPPHGRLIDADALIDKVIAKYLEHERMGQLVFAAAEIKQDICDLISDAPTIIQASEEGE